MGKLILILFASSFFACNTQTETKPGNIPAQPDTAKTISDCDIALTFINNYTDLISKRSSANIAGWIKNNPLLTNRFKITYENLLDSAQKADPEMGLDFDPVLDAQDFPEKGFELINCDKTTGYVTVRGKNWNEFLLILKLALQDDKWLIDGSGVINISVDKKAKR